MSYHHVRLNHTRWQAARKAVFRRDGWRCTACGRPGRLEAHHVTPLEKEPNQDPYDPNDLATLCRSCHIDLHRRERLSPEQILWMEFVQELV